MTAPKPEDLCRVIARFWTCWPWIICFMSSTPPVCPSIPHPSLSLIFLLPKLRDTSTQGHWQCTETYWLNKGSGKVKVWLLDWKRVKENEREKTECWNTNNRQRQTQQVPPWVYFLSGTYRTCIWGRPPREQRLQIAPDTLYYRVMWLSTVVWKRGQCVNGGAMRGC